MAKSADAYFLATNVAHHLWGSKGSGLDPLQKANKAFKKPYVYDQKLEMRLCAHYRVLELPQHCFARRLSGAVIPL
jgi:hypothetical protein